MCCCCWVFHVHTFMHRFHELPFFNHCWQSVQVPQGNVWIEKCRNERCSM